MRTFVGKGIFWYTIWCMGKNVREVSHGGLVWVNVTKQGERELGELEQRFGLNHVDVVESRPTFQRPKLVRREQYFFVVLHFPVFDRESRRLGFAEVDFFLSQHYLITVHDNKLHVIEDFFSLCRKSAEVRVQFFSGTTAHLFFELLSRLFETVFPILLHVSDDINTVDRKLFVSGQGRDMVEEILRLKTNIVAFRRTMQGHRTVLDRLAILGGRELGLSPYQNYMNSLRESTVEIWHMLESQNESINSLHETNESMITLRTNEVMRTLTVISVVTFPLTLLATLFSVNAGGTPFLHNAFGFWILLALTLVGAAVLLYVFRLRKWL